MTSKPDRTEDADPEKVDKITNFSSQAGIASQVARSRGDEKTTTPEPRDTCPAKSENHITQIIRRGYDDTIQIHKRKRKAVYYSLTETEIEADAQFGWLTTFCLTFFGVGSGFGGGCVIALIQSPPSKLALSPLFWMSLVSGFFSIILLIFAIILVHFQRKQKQQWQSKGIEGNNKSAETNISP